MESYSERLERECKEIEESFPEIKKIILEVSRIKQISTFEFDYEIERKHLMYETIKKILSQKQST